MRIIKNFLKSLLFKDKETIYTPAAQMITDTPNENGDYTFVKDNIQMIKIQGHEFKMGKIVYATFADMDLDADDPSWDVEYLDGNPMNNAFTNLKYKEINYEH